MGKETEEGKSRVTQAISIFFYKTRVLTFQLSRAEACCSEISPQQIILPSCTVAQGVCCACWGCPVSPADVPLAEELGVGVRCTARAASQLSVFRARACVMPLSCQGTLVSVSKAVHSAIKGKGWRRRKGQEVPMFNEPFIQYIQLLT